ncbi:MAG: thioredoxin domain-containing protein, partial [Actinomycetes bacterium]
MFDVTDDQFQVSVIERSMTTPVIVDLWAPWCGPCKTLGPLLEAAVAATSGAVELAKVNVDENPMISQAFKVQSIPAVFAISQGKVVNSFIGAKPEAEIVHFVASLQPAVDEISLLVTAGDEASLKKAVELDPTRFDAVAALAALLIDARRCAEAAQLLVPFTALNEAQDLLSLAVETEEALVQLFEATSAEFEGLLDKVKTDEEAKQRALELLELLPPADPRTV